jgi:hypothetical protein
VTRHGQATRAANPGLGYAAVSNHGDETISPLARRPWFLITGGMIIIGVVNVALGLWLFDDPTVEEEQEIPSFMPPLEDAAPPGTDFQPIDAGLEPSDAARP